MNQGEYLEAGAALVLPSISTVPYLVFLPIVGKLRAKNADDTTIAWNTALTKRRAQSVESLRKSGKIQGCTPNLDMRADLASDTQYRQWAYHSILQVP